MVYMGVTSGDTSKGNKERKAVHGRCIFNYFILDHSGLAMLCSCLLYSKVNQSYSYVFSSFDYFYI